MAVRQFDAVDDNISLAVGGTSGIPNGAYTIAILCKPALTQDPAAHVTLSSASAHLVMFGERNTADYQVKMGASNLNSSGAPLVSTGWQLMVVTKASGTVAPRFHTKNVTTGAAWDHRDATSSGSNQASAVTLFDLGADFDGHLGDCLLAVVGVYGYAMSDVQTTGLATNLRTSDFANAAGGAPVALVELNQASVTTALVDLVGTSNQTARTGTTVVTGSDPPGWTFDGTGVPPPTSTAGVFEPHLVLNAWF
jgi:hypothetical protein